MFSRQGMHHLSRSQTCACFPRGELCFFTAFPRGLIHANGTLPTPHVVKSSKIQDLDHNLGMHHRGLQIWGIFRAHWKEMGDLERKLNSWFPAWPWFSWWRQMFDSRVWADSYAPEIRRSQKGEGTFSDISMLNPKHICLRGDVTCIIILAKCRSLLIIWQTNRKQIYNRKSVTFFLK